jgi:hypothetical protein
MFSRLVDCPGWPDELGAHPKVPLPAQAGAADRAGVGTSDAAATGEKLAPEMKKGLARFAMLWYVEHARPARA